jgi:putative endonuclease
MKYYYVYILKCSDNSYYTGVTNDLEKRVLEHQNGDDPKSYTYRKRPLKIVWYELYNDINQAIEKEKQIKGWTRKKKEALINGDFDLLIELSKNRQVCHSEPVVCHPEPVEGQTNKSLCKKIVITGPESTGKSTLTKMLAEEYNVTWVKEYAREYLSTLRQAQGDKSYTFENVIEMAKIQLQKEQEAIIQNDLVFLDTDLTVFHVWIKEKYNKEIDWINEHLAQAQNKIYFLCDIDIPWEEDVLREHPNLKDRKRLFENYIQILENNKLTYYIISGDIATR